MQKCNAVEDRFFYTIRSTPLSPLFPYTTLFRSAPLAVLPKQSVQPGICLRSTMPSAPSAAVVQRSEEHTSALQSRGHVVCRLLLEKKNRPAATVRFIHRSP